MGLQVTVTLDDTAGESRSLATQGVPDFRLTTEAHSSGLVYARQLASANLSF